MRNGTGSQNLLWLIILGSTIALATVAQSKSDSAGDPFSQPHVVEARPLTARELKRAEAVELSYEKMLVAELAKLGDKPDGAKVTAALTKVSLAHPEILRVEDLIRGTILLEKPNLETLEAEALQLSERLSSATSITGHDVLKLRTLGLSLEWFHADQPAEKSARAFAAYEKARQLVHSKLAKAKGL